MDSLTNKEIISEMGRLEMEIAGMKTKYMELQSELITRGKQREIEHEHSALPGNQSVPRAIDIATVPMDELRQYRSDLGQRLELLNDPSAKANVLGHLQTVNSALIDRSEGRSVNDSDRAVLLGLPQQEAMANHATPFQQGYQAMWQSLEQKMGDLGHANGPADYHEEVNRIAIQANHDISTGGANAAPIIGHDQDGDMAIMKEFDNGQLKAVMDWSHQKDQYTVAEALSERYSALREEVSSVEPHTAGEAVAATNYFRGRADELNQMRETLFSQEESLTMGLPEMDLADVHVLGPKAAEQQQEQEISR